MDLRDGVRLFAQGDPADAVYAITGGAGHVRIGVMGRSTKGLMVEVFRSGDLFGEIGVIDGGVRSADALVEGHVHVLRIGASKFMQAMNEHPELGVNLCRALASRLRRTFILLEDATFESVEVRLARQVLYLAHREARRTDAGLCLAGRFRQSDLADLLGTTPRSIITILNGWRASNVVIYDASRAQLTLVDETTLQALINPGSDE